MNLFSFPKEKKITQNSNLENTKEEVLDFNDLGKYFDKSEISKIEKLFKNCRKEEIESRKTAAFPFLKSFLILHLDNPLENDLGLLHKIVDLKIWTLDEIMSDQEIVNAINNSISQLNKEQNYNFESRIKNVFHQEKKEDELTRNDKKAA